MVIELLKDWNGWKAGKRLSLVSQGAAKLLVQRGFAKQIKPRKRKAKKAS